MFILTEMQDIIRIEPRHFNHDTTQVIISTLNEKFANKVVHNVGLCIALYDILDVGDSYILPGDGSSHTKVKFRYIVFRPFIDEILVGTIRSCSPEGVRVTLNFFDDIIIPPHKLQHPSRFDSDEQVWVWEYETGDEKNDMFMDEGEEIRLKVVEERFVDISPTAQPNAQQLAADVGDHRQDTQAPYTIIGSVSESGLGLLSWWSG